jgi:hypothetical protein
MFLEGPTPYGFTIYLLSNPAKKALLYKGTPSRISTGFEDSATCERNLIILFDDGVQASFMNAEIPRLRPAKYCHCERSEAISQSFADCHGLPASQ